LLLLILKLQNAALKITLILNVIILH
jgi:hypothetical protein